MIYPDAVSAIARSEESRPKRLRRADVAALRALYATAYDVSREMVEETSKGRWVGSTTVWLPRKKAEIAAAKLGRATPGVTVVAQWTTRHVVGLDVIITAEQSIGPRARSFRLKVAEHRFRGSTTETQFCREVSHAVRLGLGWCAQKTREQSDG